MNEEQRDAYLNFQQKERDLAAAKMKAMQSVGTGLVAVPRPIPGIEQYDILKLNKADIIWLQALGITIDSNIRCTD